MRWIDPNNSQCPFGQEDCGAWSLGAGSRRNPVSVSRPGGHTVPADPAGVARFLLHRREQTARILPRRLPHQYRPLHLRFTLRHFGSLYIGFQSLLFTDQIHNPSAYVRDYYFFKRSQYPQLNLVHMDPNRAHEALQKQAFVEKMMELGKVQFVTSVLKSSNQVIDKNSFSIS